MYTPETDGTEIIFYYKVNTYEITGIAHDGGSIVGIVGEGESAEITEVNETVRYGENQTKTVKISPDRGMVVDKITVNGSEKTFTEAEDDTVTLDKFQNVVENKRIEVTFKEKEYTITYEGITDEEKIAVNNPSVYTINTPDFTLVNPVRTGYTFEGWTGTEIGDGTENATPVKEVTVEQGSTGDRTYTANWKINQYSVTVHHKENGTNTEISEDEVFPGRHSVFWEQVVGIGKPMICKYWDGTTHVDLGGNVKFLYKDTVEELTEAINTVLGSEEVFKGMQEVAQSKGMDYFSYQQIARKSLEL